MWRDKGPRAADYVAQRDAARIERYHFRRVELRGYTVTLTPHAASLTV